MFTAEASPPASSVSFHRLPLQDDEAHSFVRLAAPVWQHQFDLNID
jgi:hypothetical protein